MVDSDRDRGDNVCDCSISFGVEMKLSFGVSKGDTVVVKCPVCAIGDLYLASVESEIVHGTPSPDVKVWGGQINMGINAYRIFTMTIRCSLNSGGCGIETSGQLIREVMGYDPKFGFSGGEDGVE